MSYTLNSVTGSGHVFFRALSLVQYMRTCYISSRLLAVHWRPTMLKLHTCRESDLHLPQSQNCLLGFSPLYQSHLPCRSGMRSQFHNVFSTLFERIARPPPPFSILNEKIWSQEIIYSLAVDGSLFNLSHWPTDGSHKQTVALKEYGMTLYSPTLVEKYINQDKSPMS